MAPKQARPDEEAQQIIGYVEGLAARADAGSPATAADLRELEARLAGLRDAAARQREHLGRVHEKLDQVLADQREIERDARTDALTGLGNRAAYDEELARLWKEGRDFTVAFIDVDNLKQCNDRFGHREGNRCIQQTAFFIALNKDDSESLYRIGGDEFVFVSPVSGEFALGQRLEDARTMLKKSTARNGTMPFTFSYGCSRVRPSRGDDATQMTNDADRKMYSYKLLHRKGYARPTEDSPEAEDAFIYTERVFEALSMSDEGRYFFVCDLDRDFSRWSSNAVHDLGIPSAHLRHAGDVWLEHIHPDDREACAANFAEIYAGKRHHHFMQYRARDASGAYVLVKCRGYRLEAEGGQPPLFVGTIVNRSLAENTDPATGLGGINGFVSAIAEARDEGRPTGLVALKICGMDALNASRGYEVGDRVIASIVSQVVSAVRGRATVFRGRGAQVEVVAMDIDEKKTMELAREAHEAASGPVKVNGEDFELGVFSAWCHYARIDSQPYTVLGDLTHRLSLKERSAQVAARPEPSERPAQAEVDSRTGLRGSEAFLAAAQRMLEAGAKKSWCLATIDLGNLRIYNEWHGKEAGDLLISEVGAILRDFENEGGCVAGYWGQDDFSLFMPFEHGDAEKVLEKIAAVVSRSDGSVGFAPSMGVYPIPSGSQVDIDAYSKAFFANREVKHNFENRVGYFRPSDYEQKVQEQLMLSDFQYALAADEITFDLQPQVDIATGRVVGAEALARWRFPNGSEAAPGLFVPVLEKTGFVITLDKLIWKKVVAWQARRLADGKTCVPVSVNVSRIDIVSFDVAGCLKGLLAEFEVPASLIKAEVTESSFVETRGKVGQLTSELQKAGVSVYMDDFGTGQSSLALLRAVNMDALKLDRTFLPSGEASAHGGRRGASIVGSMAGMAASMDVPLVVEGVETDEQVELLREAGARYVQGFRYFRPMRPERFAELIDAPGKADPRGIRKPSDLLDPSGRLPKMSS